MPRRKQDCPRRRDFTQDCPEDGKTASKCGEPKKKVSNSPLLNDVVSGPLDLSTKRKQQPSPDKLESNKQKKVTSSDSAKCSPSASSSEQSPPKFFPPVFSPAAGYYPSPFEMHPFGPKFNLSGSTLMPLRLPTCPASTSSSAVTQTLLQSTFPVPSNNKNSKFSLNDSLDKLSDLVQTVGSSNKQRENGKRNFQESNSTSAESKSPNTTSSDLSVPATDSGMTMQELWWKYMKKEESAELKRINEAKQIFTCLQCHQSFQSMDQLVKHMEVSQHFTNVPKHYSWSLQYARQKMRQMKLKLKYSERMMYFCHLCVAPFTVAVHQHFSEVHDMHNPVDNMNFVQIVMVNGGDGCIKPAQDASSTASLDHRTPTPGSSCESSESRSPAFSSPPSAKPDQLVPSAFKEFLESRSTSPSKKVPLLSISAEKGLSIKNNEEIKVEASDNLLVKMEELVKSAVDQTYQKPKKAVCQEDNDNGLPLPASKNFISGFSKKKS